MTKKGTFVISLDYELFWGVRDFLSREAYGENIRAVREVIPAMLALFRKYEVHTTFATVGFLFAKDKTELQSFVPTTLPAYENTILSPYLGHFDTIGTSDADDPLHFGYKLLRQIRQTPFQEIGTHTFSHYYCLEKGQRLQSFQADVQASQQIAEKEGLSLKSIVFPRNQYNQSYLQACQQAGITSYRGNENSWVYKAQSRQEERLIKRAFRLLDSYLNVTGHHLYTMEALAGSFPYNIPSSRFLRPYSARLSFLEGLKIRRIKRSMTKAAQQHKLYHLWWHPHNFGSHLSQNLAILEEILKHFQHLQKTYGFQSLNMEEISEQLSQDAS